MQKNTRKNMSYSFYIKLKAVKMYLDEGIESTTIEKELNLSSNKRVLLWVKRYNEFGEYGLRERRGTTRRLQKGRPRKQQLSLEGENQLLEIYNKSKKVYCYRRINIGLFRSYGLIVNHKKIIRLRKSLNINSVIRRKKFKYYAPKALDIGRGRVEPNLLNREFNCNAPNQKWVTDITYLKYDNGRIRMYLSAIEDLYNREI